MLRMGPYVGQRAARPWVGTLATFRQDPLVAAGVFGASRYVVGDLLTVRGGPMPEVPPGTEWGIGQSYAGLDEREQYQAPADASERLRTFDVLRCVEAFPLEITPLGVTYEIAHFDIPSSCIGILERIPTEMYAQALDGDGLPIYNYGNLNGERPCTRELVHPDPEIAPLRWQWAITMTHSPYYDRATLTPPLTYLGPIPPTAIEGTDLVPRWNDLRYGHASRWGDRWQLLLPARAVVRYWITLSGPTARYSVHVGARLGGYWQLGGRRGVAVVAATQRIV